ncbi:MAG: esterase-like activity of phytase family protein [Pseudomonadota bacterium]
MKRVLWALLLAAACGPVATGPGAAGPGGTPGLAITSAPVDIDGGVLTGLTLRGTVALTASPDEFGGFSGLHIDQGHMVAVNDIGWWLLADLDDTDNGLAPDRAGFAPMLDADGAAYDKAGGDAEGLTMRDGFLAVSFERDHRIMFHQGDGRMGDLIQDRAFERLGTNKGLEALATTPDGWMLAIAEEPENGAFPVHLVRYSNEVRLGSLPALTRHSVTGADVGPDGKLYLLQRDYTPILGVSIRILRYALGDDGFPIAETREELAAFESSSGIDNMEGIALWTDQTGRTRLTLISDDNFNLIQRTLLMDFEVSTED